MTIPRIGGPNVPLDLGTNAGFWSRAVQGGAGYPFNGFVLPSGGSFLLPPGVYNVVLGPLSYLQVKDPVQGTWRTFSAAGLQGVVIADGGNYRIANLAGTVQTVTITAAGSGYNPAAPPTIGVSAGGAVVTPIIGGAVATAVTTGGAGYTQSNPPALIFSAPGPGGIQATGTATVSAGGVITGVTMTNAGAGYSSPPSLLVVNDPRVPNPTTAAVLTTSLTGAGTVTGALIVDPGVGQGAAPTLTFSAGAATATAAVYTGTAGPDSELVLPG